MTPTSTFLFAWAKCSFNKPPAIDKESNDARGGMEYPCCIGFLDIAFEGLGKQWHYEEAVNDESEKAIFFLLAPGIMPGAD